GPIAESGEWTRYEMLKHLVYLLTHPDGSTEPLVIALPGDREVDAKRLEAAGAPAIAAPFTDADFPAHPTLQTRDRRPTSLRRSSGRGPSPPPPPRSPHPSPTRTSPHTRC